MSGFLGLLKRIRHLNAPPSQPPKDPHALRFGILGAARIGPNALIIPAMSHSDVIVYAVASRDSTRGAAYAKKHQIPKTYSGDGCYQSLVEDSEIDVVYVALPNGSHYEWTMRALEQGKHVLVEKPMADTAAEAQQIIDLAEKNNLIVLEAIHYTFHPATQRAKEIVDSGKLGKITSIRGEFAVPNIASSSVFLKDDVRFNYDLGGGCTMDMGVYPLSALRYFTSSDPVKVTGATATGHPSDPARVDRAMHARFTFPPAIEGETFADFSMPGWGPFNLLPRSPKCTIFITLEEGEIEYYNFAIAHMYHSITVKPRGGKARTEKAYQFKDGPGEEWWSTYRYQLEAFVDKVRGREPQFWPPASDPVKQLQWIEDVYSAADMPRRPVSRYFASPRPSTT